MITSTRREVVAGAASLCASAAAGSMAMPDAQVSTSRADLDRYVALGGKASGGPGDDACGVWIEDVLRASRFRCTRTTFDAPFFDVSVARLRCGDSEAEVLPQAIVTPTGSAGVAGPLIRVSPFMAPITGLRSAIALVDLPSARWSSALVRPVRDTVTAAFAAGAVACVLVTNGPEGEAIALNADGRSPMFAGPVAILAPKDASPFLAAAAHGEQARLTVDGRGGRRPAFNIVARLDRGRGRSMVVSTPRSGWFTCAGERGGGVAAFLALARWAPSALPSHDLTFVCNSGHEYEYLGAEKTLASNLPPPASTDLWLHLGANVASRDWHELPNGLRPLDTADPQRILAVSTPFLGSARRLFKGQPGLGSPYDSKGFVAGELSNVIKAGYPAVAGIFGAHRYHHTRADDARCLDVAATDEVIASLNLLLIAAGQQTASH